MNVTPHAAFTPSALVEIDDHAVARFQQRGLKLRTGLFAIGGETAIETPCCLAAGFDLSTTGLIGAFTYSWSRVENVAAIGRYCSIAGGVEFGGQEHPTDWLSTSSFAYDDGFIWRDFEPDGPFKRCDLPTTRRRSVVIGNDVWIGAGAYIKAGVTIGDGAVIGCRALVTKDVPPYAVVAGVPATVIRYRFDQATIDRLQKIAWWRFSFRQFDFDVRDVPGSLSRLEDRAAAGQLVEYRPEPIRLVDEGLPRPLPTGFNPATYLALNLDVALSGVDPAAHYLEFGWKEGRPFS